jgi:4'-phosphopantetheinyl transferase
MQHVNVELGRCRRTTGSSAARTDDIDWWNAMGVAHGDAQTPPRTVVASGAGSVEGAWMAAPRLLLAQWWHVDAFVHKDLWRHCGGAGGMETGLTNKKSLRLRPGQVDVWLISLSGVGNDQRLACLQFLSEPERAKWQRFVVQDARVQYLVSRALVRATLSRYAEVPENVWQFETNHYGRPHVSQPRAWRDIRFNLSNTTGLVVCAVSNDCEIGIDVENISRTLDTEALAPTVFAPAELTEFRRTGPEDRRNRFFSYWTLKEAYIKARGMGLSLPLDAFWFDLGGPSPLLHVTDRCPDVPERWRFYQHAPTNEHRMAVAVAGPQACEPSVHLHWVTPASLSAGLASPRCSFEA